MLIAFPPPSGLNATINTYNKIASLEFELYGDDQSVAKIIFLQKAKLIVKVGNRTLGTTTISTDSRQIDVNMTTIEYGLHVFILEVTYNQSATATVIANTSTKRGM